MPYRLYTKQGSTLITSTIFFSVVGIIYLYSATCSLTGRQKTEQEKANNNNDICQTPGCVSAAIVVLKYMNRNVDPCENFYKFACDGFLDSPNDSGDDGKLDVFTPDEVKISRQLRNSYEAITVTDQTRHLKLVKNLYDNCMNTSRIETDGLAPLQNIIKKLGGWPVLEGEAWVDEEFDWIKTSSKLRNAGFSVNYILEFEVDIDIKNSSRRLIYISEPALDNLNRTKKIEIFSSPGDRQNLKKLYTLTTLGQLAKDYSSIAWRDWFMSLLPSTIILAENEPVMLASSYIIKLQKLLNTTRKRTVANYMFWRLIDSSIKYLNKKIRYRMFVFSSTMLGGSQRQPRWKECVSTVTEALPMSAGALYVKNYFDKKAKMAVLEISENTRVIFRKKIEKVDWMDNVTKKIALEKLDMMTFHVAYPDELLNDTEVDAYYQSFELTGGNYLESISNLTLFMILKEYSSLRLPVDKDKWTVYGEAATSNAMNKLSYNAIILYAAFLQGIRFNSNRPRYMNYGGIGVTIGHEIIHGFDDLGRQFDKHGNMVDWWESASEANFIERVECIRNQYNNYILEFLGKNETDGELKQGENIADNGAIRLAYLAYVAWEAGNKPEQALWVLPYTPRQMFWISTANVFCRKMELKDQAELLRTDEHSPTEFRVNGPLSNSAEFSKDFNCPVGSRMNPVNKCGLW